ncbi:MBL fold metallo-hydrolase [Tahibacter amnicola]|uniref:MBL fold metallo-hydrolase n=1 Tax=Tahibacter amnicola TaxID=2976241 RepID=A0ABY6BD33_9GAMM|nr:MBL fold metallo-hydrolase [Tahibacter amnicola]UXI67123.1 MBL fold metallo-hydrolase [Tahibacter amnicola]
MTGTAVPSIRVDVHLLSVGYCRHPEWVTMRGGALRSCTFPSLCALIVHPQLGPILYDTGYADHFLAATSRFPEMLYRWVTPVGLSPEQRLEVQLSQRGVRLRDIRFVVISHFHADHVAGLRDLPQARFIALRGEVDHLRRKHAWNALRKGFLPALLPPDFDARVRYADDSRAVTLGAAWRPFEHAFDILGDGSLLGVPLSGHTQSQMGLLCRDRNDRLVLLAADACWSARAFREQRMPSVLARLLMHDWAEYARTLHGLHAVSCSLPELAVIPSHCGESIAAYRQTVAPPDEPRLSCGENGR